MREMLAEGKVIREKTYAEENLEQLETRVAEGFLRNRLVDTQHQQVTDLRNKAALYSEALANKEKLAGDFSLRLNTNLKMHQKIEKYAQDSVIFFLHKNRNFVEKIQRQEKEAALQKKADAEKERIVNEEALARGNRLARSRRRSMHRQGTESQQLLASRENA